MISHRSLLIFTFYEDRRNLRGLRSAPKHSLKAEFFGCESAPLLPQSIDESSFSLFRLSLRGTSMHGNFKETPPPTDDGTGSPKTVNFRFRKRIRISPRLWMELVRRSGPFSLRGEKSTRGSSAGAPHGAIKLAHVVSVVIISLLIIWALSNAH
jgi:hypothetical protein